jgi:aryl-alcohol dehydrogenase-like predicted oxidoreductase
MNYESIELSSVTLLQECADMSNQMRYKLLGKSGLRVSELSLGTMTFGDNWGWGSSFDESKKVFDSYAEAGGNFVDTANRYTDGTSEEYVGNFIAADREHFVVATKYTLSGKTKNPNASGNHRKNLVQALDASLKRLKTDYIDLYWVHAWDFTTPIEEVMRALDDQVRAGKILHIGVSDTPAWVVSRANTIAEHRGWTPFTALQIEYSLIERTPERDLVPMANALDIAVTPWAPLAGGLLTGKYTAEAKPHTDLKEGERAQRLLPGQGRLAENNLAIARVVDEVAKEAGVSASQVAIAWLLAQPGVMVPIVGARRVAQIQDNLGAVNVKLSAAQLQQLSAASKIDLGFPHSFLQSQGVKDVVFGGMADQLDFQEKV